MTTKILLADDSLTIQKVVSLTFASEDVQIEAVTNGSLAIEKARSFRPHVILADVFMPGCNGYEVCDTVKKDPELGKIPVVLLVGTFEPFDEVEASRVGCDAHLTKPFDTSELIKVVNELASDHRKMEPGLDTPYAAEPSILEAVDGAGIAAQGAALVSSRTRESFLGENRILDIFDLPPRAPEVAAPVQEAAPELKAVPVAAPEPDAHAVAPVIPFPGTTRIAAPDPHPLPLSEETIDLIVEKVVKRLSDQVVRDIAWEVVPALSEIMIRQYIDELKADRPS